MPDLEEFEPIEYEPEHAAPAPKPAPKVEVEDPAMAELKAAMKRLWPLGQ